MEAMSKEYLLIEIDGDEQFMRGYIEGYFAATGKDMNGLYYGSEVGLDDERFLTKVKHFLGVELEHNLLIVQKEVLPILDEAFSRLQRREILAIRSKRPLQRIEFPFRVDTPSREVAGQLKGLLAALPEGSRIERLTLREDKLDDEFETSAYAPEHPYRLRVSGVLTGEIEPVLKTYRLLSEFENVVFDEPHLVFA